MSQSKNLSEYYHSMLNKFDNSSNHIEDIKNFTSLVGKRILITGAAGSIGSELAKKIVCTKPGYIGLLDINESELNNLKLEISEYSDCPVHIFLCDVSRKKNIEYIFKEFKPEIVYHVAAYKHIPILENHPEEALRVNIIGTYNIALLAGKFDVQKFIFISTDKAVNPVSIMGKSKKIAENIIHKIRRNYLTDFIIVRFCNVIGSRGSVSEIFIKQILRGGPVTITNPKMERYFMTITQAVNLVLKASEFGIDGNLFIPKLNRSIRIIELLNEFIKKFNPSKKTQIKVQIIGCHSGEKLYEELMTLEESKYVKCDNGFYRIDTDYLNIDCNDYLDFVEFEDDFSIKDEIFALNDSKIQIESC